MTKQDEINKLIGKAERYLTIAENDIKNKNYDAGVSRAYYAMFYCAEALLLTKDLRFSKHSAVHSAFGKYFARAGIIDVNLHRMLLDAFEMRSNGDYEYMKEINTEEAEQMLKDAEFFVSEIKKRLEKK